MKLKSSSIKSPEKSTMQKNAMNKWPLWPLRDRNGTASSFSGIVYGEDAWGPKIQRACVGMRVEALDFS